MELKDRLKKIRTERGLSQAKLAELAGVTQPTIMFIENGRNKGSSKIVDIANALGVSPNWLTHGVEDVITPNTQKNTPSTINTLESDGETIGMEEWDDDTPLSPNEVEVPFFKDVRLSAGNGCFLTENYFPARKLRFSKHTLAAKGIDYKMVVCVTAKGESMEPVIPDGCTVAVNLDDKEIKDGQMYAINNDGLLQIKVLKWQSGSRIFIESYNPTYATENAELSQIEVLGRVFWYSVLL